MSLAFAATSCGLFSNRTQAIILATTTSTQDSGLLDVLVPSFERETGIRVKTIAVGTGQALAMGARGDADVLLVHSPKDEEAFMAEGNGLERRLVMYNDFVLVGPASDPAGASRLSSIAEAMRAIASSGSVFVSRGDESGTHKLEKQLWSQAGLSPVGSWYKQTGQGMGQTLIIASEMQAYTLTDRATFLAQKSNLRLAMLRQGDRPLLNVYHVIVVNPERFPRVNANEALAFADFLTSARGQAVIASFGKERFGQSLFVPAAGQNELELNR
jgi:tungstate transport system substrate-binding protein